VDSPRKQKLEKSFPACRSVLDANTWDRIVTTCDSDPEAFPEAVALHTGDPAIPDFLGELARVERAVNKVTNGEEQISLEVNQLEVNPTLQLLQLSWKNLTPILDAQAGVASQAPEPGEEFVLVWRDPKTAETRAQAASDEDLLVLKMHVEGIEPEEAAATGELPIGAVDSAIDRAVGRGILLQPPSRIRRNPASFPVGENTDEQFLSTSVFALQWHITQVCDLHCKHCYDRSNRSPLKLEKAIEILDDLRAFCLTRHVGGHVSFTGGNPLLYPRFPDLYRAASDRGLGIAILGNPAPKEGVEELLEIQQPSFFQVSLEGLPEHNDTIRGSGHFERVIEFLEVLRELDVFSMVMLTLTRDNIDQVLPLGEMLRDLTDSFNFNRLSMVGEGASLHLPTRSEYMNFLEAYMEAAENNPVLRLKDNLINILCKEKGLEPFGGCTGYGCGAAFNFIVALSDGQAHACRKFPSPIGNVLEQSISDIYDSEIAARYRSGCQACRDCTIRPVCGGCMAIAHSHGLNVFEDRDPYCFIARPDDS
jgi:selenobiotic family peptide radical SAM maturase